MRMEMILNFPFEFDRLLLYFRVFISIEAFQYNTKLDFKANCIN